MPGSGPSPMEPPPKVLALGTEGGKVEVPTSPLVRGRAKRAKVCTSVLKGVSVKSAMKPRLRNGTNVVGTGWWVADTDVAVQCSFKGTQRPPSESEGNGGVSPRGLADGASEEEKRWKGRG
eukprot:Sspe_Gene.74405::Locus_46114_Transcript_1_1_Confidence_1.000_Length_486::g.74405::m.74405